MLGPPELQDVCMNEISCLPLHGKDTASPNKSARRILSFSSDHFLPLLSLFFSVVKKMSFFRTQSPLGLLVDMQSVFYI